MAYELEHRLVIGVASSALFDLTESHAVFLAEGEDGYREYQESNLAVPLKPGVAFPFIKRLLSLNDLSDVSDPLVEVIVLSSNDPDTGLRVMESVEHHSLSITRAVFMQGRSPFKFMPAFSMSLFLSENEADVRQAVLAGLPAGRVMGSPGVDDESEDLRIAFDFDAVLASDESERVMKESGESLAVFREHEVENAALPLEPGPLKDFLEKLNIVQRREEERRLVDEGYRIRVHVALVTARNAPAHRRAVDTLKSWGLRVNDAFFLGGVEKRLVLEVLKPHIFFDDQLGHINGASQVVPSVHVPYGIRNLEPGASPL